MTKKDALILVESSLDGIEKDYELWGAPSELAINEFDKAIYILIEHGFISLATHSMKNVDNIKEYWVTKDL